MFAAKDITSGNVDKYCSDEKLVKSAVAKLKKAGFQVLQVSPTSISICAEKSVYEKVFKTSLVPTEVEMFTAEGSTETLTAYDCPDTELFAHVPTEKSELSDVLEGIALARPPIYFANAFAPTKSYWHLRVPGDVSLGVNADRAHRKGFTGKKVRAVMVDTGWQAHPYFIGRGYNIQPTVLGPGAVNANLDGNGHGTAESANLLAVAPDAIFRMVKMDGDPVGAFNTAVALSPRPHIISCSWGFSIQFGPLDAFMLTLAAAVANAVSLGITVVFSAGNGHWGFPGQHPDVISAGGVFMETNGAKQASDYASGFASNIYIGRNVPDVSGLVGMQPRAAYIMLPLPDGCSIDTNLAGGGMHPNSDETMATDGWAAISGTSAAAPQIAGACALLKQRRPAATPAQVKSALKNTAIDITIGNCNPATGGNPAIPGPDLATGHGLIDAIAAVSAI